MNILVISLFVAVLILYLALALALSAINAGLRREAYLRYERDLARDDLMLAKSWVRANCE